MRSEKSGVAALLLSGFAATAASLSQTTVLGKQVYDLTRSELALGLLGLAEFAPAALLVLVTGAVADRFDRRRVAAVALVGEAGVSLALAWYASTDPTSAAPIFGMVIAFGVTRAFVAPAERSLPADMVSGQRLPWLIARNSAAFQAAIIVGPVLGGFLYTVHVWVPYVVNAGLTLIGAALVLTIYIPPSVRRAASDDVIRAEAALEAAVEPVEGHATEAQPNRAGLHEAMEGLRFIRNQDVLLGAISLDLFAVLFGGAIALLPAIAEDRLGVGAVGLGWLRAAGGIGASLVTLALAARPLRRRIGRTLLAVVAVFGVGTIVLGLTHSFAVAFIAMAVLSGADAISVFIRATLVPLITPEDKRGRVLAVENVFIGASNELGAFESGVAGQFLGTAVAVVLGGAATLAVAGLWWFVFPALRNVDRFPAGANDILTE